MNGAIRQTLALALTAATAVNALAGNVVCSGTVDVLAYHQPGRLMIKLSSMNTAVFICSTDADWTVAGSLAGTTTPSACKALYATFLSAKLTRAPINNMYFDGDDVPASCNSFSPWMGANVRYYDY